jgi:hypothetical protein
MAASASFSAFSTRACLARALDRLHDLPAGLLDSNLLLEGAAELVARPLELGDALPQGFPELGKLRGPKTMRQ